MSVQSIPVPVDMRPIIVCEFQITRDRILALLGEPAYIETDDHRTFGGHEWSWGFIDQSGCKMLVQFNVNRQRGCIYADPPENSDVLACFGDGASEVTYMPYPVPQYLPTKKS